MGRRSDHTRDELYAMALDAARDIVKAEGLPGLTARAVAGRIGYSPGTLYNLFANLDELILHLNAGTLRKLRESLPVPAGDQTPEDGLLALARAYIAFTTDEPALWSALFEHRLPDDDPPPWYLETVADLLSLVEATLAPLFPTGAEDERRRAARILWSGLHGICSLAQQGKLDTLTDDPVETLAESLVRTYVAGLRTQSGG